MPTTTVEAAALLRYPRTSIPQVESPDILEAIAVAVLPSIVKLSTQVLTLGIAVPTTYGLVPLASTSG